MVVVLIVCRLVLNFLVKYLVFIDFVLFSDSLSKHEGTFFKSSILYIEETRDLEEIASFLSQFRSSNFVVVYTRNVPNIRKAVKEIFETMLKNSLMHTLVLTADPKNHSNFNTFSWKFKKNHYCNISSVKISKINSCSFGRLERKLVGRKRGHLNNCKLKVGYVSLPPLTIHKEEGPEGIETELIKLIALKMDFELEFHHYEEPHGVITKSGKYSRLEDIFKYDLDTYYSVTQWLVIQDKGNVLNVPTELIIAKWNVLKNLTEGLLKVVDHHVAFCVPEFQKDYFTKSLPELREIKGKITCLKNGLTDFNINMLFRDRLLLGDFDFHLQRLVENGFTLSWIESYMNDYSSKIVDIDQALSNVKIRFEHLMSVLLMLVVGNVLAIGVFGLEVFWGSNRNSRQTAGCRHLEIKQQRQA
ncbi:unnamed protein product [Acanthoscelides obtectus]|uniref:Uncharacterized protein n=1 Tax=Acanthoscelides obtectus TaxID=200917 RepID=A0A9P0PIJ3_ACAOB|nr:unnamed protein product [Acanthoscelides obtectus]CAK1677079.1 hypothetical protein AOBTE_LOCUS31101 [Acanthoscelides obtectus]